MKLRRATVESPVGHLTLVAGEAGLVALSFDEQEARAVVRRRFGPEAALATDRDPDGVVTRLKAYFDGDLRALAAIRVDPHGTPFQRRVWDGLLQIPVGATRSYRDLALATGNANATRAVGLANGQNPIAIVIPCHRVIRSDGDLCGYGGGVPRKRWLLAHEGALPGARQGRLFAQAMAD